jgi:mono/diheme cytochrome c family protein
MPLRYRLLLLAVLIVVMLQAASLALNLRASLSGKKQPVQPSTPATATTPTPATGSTIPPLSAFPDAKTVRRVDPDSTEGHFVRERIQAVFARNCYACHAGNMRMGGLRLDTLEGLLEGGFDDGPAVIPGDIRRGSLLPSLRHEGDTAKHMPPGLHLPPETIADITRWIADGAAWPRDTTPISPSP